MNTAAMKRFLKEAWVLPAILLFHPSVGFSGYITIIPGMKMEIQDMNGNPVTNVSAKLELWHQVMTVRGGAAEGLPYPPSLFWEDQLLKTINGVTNSSGSVSFKGQEILSASPWKRKPKAYLFPYTLSLSDTCEKLPVIYPYFSGMQGIKQECSLQSKGNIFRGKERKLQCRVLLTASEIESIKGIATKICASNPSQATKELHQAILHNDLNSVQNALSKGADPNAHFSYGYYFLPLLSIASIESDPELVSELINHGADVNSMDTELSTPLMWATRRENLEVVKLLLSTKGVDINKQNIHGLTAFMYSVPSEYTGNARWHDLELVKLFLDNTSRTELKINARTKKDQTALGIYLNYNKNSIPQSGSTEFLKLLKEAGAEE